MRSHRQGFALFVSMTAALATVLALSAFASQQGALEKKHRPSPPWQVHEAITHSNLSIFPVTGSRGPVQVNYLTLDEGLSAGSVEVTELGAALARRRPGAPRPPQAQVNRLTLLNHSKRPLLLLSGEIVTGGKQDRVVSADRIVSPGAELPLDVFCVEPGRWNNASLNFTGSNMMAALKIRQKAAVAKNQQEVWAANDTVRSGVVGGMAARAMPAPPPPAGASEEEIEVGSVTETVIVEAAAALNTSSSYAVLEEDRAFKRVLDRTTNRLQRDYEKALKEALKGKKVTGVIVAINGEVVWADLFAGADLFDLYWPKLLRSYAVEAMSVPTKEHASASLPNAQRFLYELFESGGRQIIEVEPGEFRLVHTDHPRYDAFELFSLFEKNEPLLHFSKLRKETVEQGKVKPLPILRR